MIIVVMGVCGCGKTTVGSSLAAKLGCSFADADQFHSEANKAKMTNGQPLTDQDRVPWLLSIHEYIMSKHQDGQQAVVTCSALKYSYRNVLRLGQKAGISSISMDNNNGAEETTKTSQAAKEDQANIAAFHQKPRNCSLKQAAATRFSLKSENVYNSKDSSDKLDNGIKSGEKLNVNDIIDSNIKGSHSSSNGMVPVFVHLTGSLEVLEDRLSNRKGHFMPKSLLQSQLDTLEVLCQDELGFTVDIEKTADDLVNEIINKLDTCTV